MKIHNLLFLALPFLVTSPASAITAPPAAADDIVVSFENDGTPLVDFLAFAQTVLGKQIYYTQQEVEQIVVQAIGKTSIPRDQFRAFVEGTLYSKGLLLVQIGDALHVRMPNGGVSGRQGWAKAQAEFVPLDKLTSYTGRYVVISVVVPVLKANPQEVNNTLQTYFTDPAIDSVRVAGSTIVMTGMPHTLMAAIGMVQALDASGAEQRDALTDRISALEKRIASLEAQLAPKSDGLKK